MRLAFFGLTISSSWGNGHATTYRGLLAGLHQRGHQVAFYEREAEWYASNRDLTTAPYAEIRFYRRWEEIQEAAADEARRADAIIAASYCPDAIPLLDFLVGPLLGRARAAVGFYDIDTPVTLAALRRGDCAYLRADQIPRLDFYLSFTAGPMLAELERHWGVRRARALACCCDPSLYPPRPNSLNGHSRPNLWTLGYMGTYAPDRQAKVKEWMLSVAARAPAMGFVVAGPLYPDVAAWPANVRHLPHLAPSQHAAFYHSCRFTLNLTRRAMEEWGYSPSIRLFEAAACATPIITDPWPGLEEFFAPGEEILVARDGSDVLGYLRNLSPPEANRIGAAARRRFLRDHTGLRRAAQLEACLAEVAAEAADHSPLVSSDSRPTPTPH